MLGTSDLSYAWNFHTVADSCKLSDLHFELLARMKFSYGTPHTKCTTTKCIRTILDWQYSLFHFPEVCPENRPLCWAKGAKPHQCFLFFSFFLRQHSLLVISSLAWRGENIQCSFIYLLLYILGNFHHVNITFLKKEREKGRERQNIVASSHAPDMSYNKCQAWNPTTSDCLPMNRRSRESPEERKGNQYRVIEKYESNKRKMLNREVLNELLCRFQHKDSPTLPTDIF